jgi:Tfp pilus tip-associated adhesin PilY1
MATLCTGTVSVAGVRAKKTDTTLTTRTYLDGSVTGPTSSSSSAYTSACLDPATAPALPPDATVVNPPVVVASTFSTGSSNSLADVAQYYYKNDLRPSLINDVRASGTSWGADRANWQHMTTFVVGLGVSGTLNYQEDYATATTGDFSKVRLGTLGWPRWPEPSLDYTTYAQLYNDPRSIDDFWHTAVNGRGKYFSANNPDSVVSGIRGALAAIDASVAAGTSVAISDLAGFTVGGLSFASTYVTGRWTGDLQARSAATSTVAWSARAMLNGQVQNCL